MDERHILDNHMREQLSLLIRTANPIEALDFIYAGLCYQFSFFAGIPIEFMPLT